jgi:hypothetical protein
MAEQSWRFLAKDYPKDREFRRFKLSTHIAARLQAHLEQCGLRRHDLVFQAGI